MNAVVNMHRYPTLEDDYANAWSEWDMTGEAEVWDETTGDGLAIAAR